MSTLLGWAIICGLFTVFYTAWAAFSSSKVGGQSMRDSMMETWTNIVIGFSVNYAANMIVLPMDGHDISPESAFLIGVIYTAISVVRQFVLRRVYNWKHERKLARNARSG